MTGNSKNVCPAASTCDRALRSNGGTSRACRNRPSLAAAFGCALIPNLTQRQLPAYAAMLGLPPDLPADLIRIAEDPRPAALHIAMGLDPESLAACRAALAAFGLDVEDREDYFSYFFVVANYLVEKLGNKNLRVSIVLGWDDADDRRGVVSLVFHNAAVAVEKPNYLGSSGTPEDFAAAKQRFEDLLREAGWAFEDGDDGLLDLVNDAAS